MTWTQPVCRADWEQRNPGREPVRLTDPDDETCCYCGDPTTSGIYMRVDPHTVPYPRQGDS